MATPAPVRLRLVFDNRRLLRRAQRDDGLRRCWLLLHPELATIADLAAHIAARFRLRRSCPRGVVLSMDGFALPPFESTCIFRDNDIIRVKQKSCKNMLRHNDVNCIQDPEIIEKRPLPIDEKILAIEYKKDNNKLQEEEQQGDHQHEETATVSHNIECYDATLKRKWHDGDAGIPESSKKKKLKVTNPGKQIGCSKEDNVHPCQDQSRSKKLMPSSIDIEAKKETLQAETTGALDEKQKTERNNQTELNCKTMVADCNVQSDTKKSESRSARRKKQKRKLRQQAKAQSEKSVQEESPTTADRPSSSNQYGLPCPSSNELHVPFSSHKTDEENSDTSEDIVPVVVRPGHIRFEPAGGEPEKSPTNETQGNFQWSGTMSKKKGQKWGMNNSNKKNAISNYHAGTNGSSAETNLVVDNKIMENGICGDSNQNVCEGSIDESACVKTVAEEGKSGGGPLDFESLYPLTRLPKEGDLIAYRLVELSSSWCPEISPYRVGKVLIYDPISLRIILLPVPEYPKEKKPDDESDTIVESDMLVDMSPYSEDGSLEIEYSSLLDVRLLKGDESVPAGFGTSCTETGKKGGSPGTLLDKNEYNIHRLKAPLVPTDTKAPEVTPEKRQNTVWEETVEVPTDKPEVQENGWGTWTPNASTSAWSLRALRSTAIGPTVAILRGKNSQRGKPHNRKYGK